MIFLYYYSPSQKSPRLTHYPPQRYANLSCYPFTDCCVKEWAKKNNQMAFSQNIAPIQSILYKLDWVARGSKENKDKQSFHQWRSCGPMDKASDYESGDCRFESCQGQHFFHKKLSRCEKKFAPPGGLEPPTFRLTAERASQLRHGGCTVNMLEMIPCTDP